MTASAPTTRTVEAAAATALQVELRAGRVELRPAPEGTTGIRGTLTGEPDVVEQIAVTTSGDTLVVEQPAPSGWSPSELLQRVTLSLEVPDGSRLRSTTGAAELSSQVGLEAASVQTGAGEVRLARVGELVLHAGAADVAVEELTGPGRITTGAGAVRLGRVTGSLSARTGAGDVEVDRLEAPLQAHTAAGSLTVRATTASVEARTAVGTITVGVADEIPTLVDLHSGLGRVRVELPPTEPPAADDRWLRVHARSATGDILLHRA
ncbi:DUF4097 family beta strand repeat-containing protein [Desertihabitans brevis]|nr:DUF4097 family beta strand repeat-containing protein [Desertihabitans brevis]